MENVFETINKICREVFESPGLNLKRSDAPVNIRGWNSLTHVMLIAEIEKRYDISFGFRDLAAILTVGDLVDITESKIQGSPAV